MCCTAALGLHREEEGIPAALGGFGARGGDQVDVAAPVKATPPKYHPAAAACPQRGV